MKIKNLVTILIIVILYSCTAESENHVGRRGQNQHGLFIENGPRQGIQYIDSTTAEYNYRYYTITITNDSTLPIQLDIGFSSSDVDSFGNSKVFLLPRHLTPSKQQFDESISEELKKFLKFETSKPQRLNKTIAPTEKCVLTFGFLTAVKYPDPTTPHKTRLVIDAETSSTASATLKVNDTLSITCGRISYIQ